MLIPTISCCICIFSDPALLTALMCSKKFTAIHARVVYMKISPAEGLTIPLWGIMNASMTLHSQNYLTITSYRLDETEWSRYGNKLIPNIARDFPEGLLVRAQ